jgi:hypothetical protein
MAKFTCGTDPEFMLMTRDGKYKSAIGIVVGSKHNKYKIGDFCFYYDNVMAECTVPPSRSKSEFVYTIRKALRTYSDLVSPHKIVIQASQEYPKSELQHEDAMAIGCERENCAYQLIQPEPPEDAFRSGSLRSAGGHIHLGAEIAQDPYGALFTVRMLDLFLGIPSIWLDKDETSKRRKELYGLSGRFRMPPHGVEYRASGNFWLASPKLTEFVYDVCEFTLNFVEEQRWRELWSVDEDKLQDDESWNDENFNPADCHVCNGYDVKALRKAVDGISKTGGKKFIPLLNKYLPPKIMSSFKKLSDARKPDLQKEWDL